MVAYRRHAARRGDRCARCVDRARRSFAELQPEELTSTGLAQRIAAGATAIIVPIGGTEQNGAYIALGKHNARVRILSERIATELGRPGIDAIVASTVEAVRRALARHR